MIAKSVENLRNWKVNKLRINKEKVIQSNTSNNNPVVMNLNKYLHIQCIRNVMGKKYLKNSTRHCKWENSLPILHFKNADLGFHKLLSRSVLEVKNCSWARGHDIYLQCRCMKVIWASILTAIDPTLSRDFFFLEEKNKHDLQWTQSSKQMKNKLVFEKQYCFPLCFATKKNQNIVDDSIIKGVKMRRVVNDKS